MTWFTIVCIILAFSIVLNVFVIWYCVRLLRELIQVSDTIEDLFIDVSSFSRDTLKVFMNWKCFMAIRL